MKNSSSSSSGSAVAVRSPGGHGVAGCTGPTTGTGFEGRSCRSSGNPPNTPTRSAREPQAARPRVLVRSAEFSGSKYPSPHWPSPRFPGCLGVVPAIAGLRKRKRSRPCGSSRWFPVLRDDQRRTRWYRPPTAATDTRQQHRRSGIIAATCPAVRVRIMNPTLPGDLQMQQPTDEDPRVSRPRKGRAYGFCALTITLTATRVLSFPRMSPRISWTSLQCTGGRAPPDRCRTAPSRRSRRRRIRPFEVSWRRHARQLGTRTLTQPRRRRWS